MSIQPLDMKILWGKASARCAICLKREKVVTETSENKGRTDILFGDMCHIIGEEEAAARGASAMPVDDRNRYHNLILLCRNHHAIIDKDVTTYTIEKLHQIKTDHELWIDSRLDEAVVDQADELYAKLVNAITDDLQLHRLDGVSNGVINGRLPAWFVDGADQLLAMVFRTNWPGERPEIEVLLKEVASRLDTFTKVFVSNSELDHAYNCYRESKKYKYAPPASDEYDQLLNDHQTWEKKSIYALWNLVAALNGLAEAVRKELKPSFFFMEGKFIINDELGTTNEGIPTQYAPTKYRPLN